MATLNIYLSALSRPTGFLDNLALSLITFGQERAARRRFTGEQA